VQFAPNDTPKKTDKTLNSSFNTDLLEDMMNMSMVSFRMESTSQLGLGEIGESQMLSGISDINLM
jgi:hypothetical protein